eukprot:RCo007856
MFSVYSVMTRREMQRYLLHFGTCSAWVAVGVKTADACGYQPDLRIPNLPEPQDAVDAPKKFEQQLLEAQRKATGPAAVSPGPTAPATTAQSKEPRKGWGLGGFRLWGSGGGQPPAQV